MLGRVGCILNDFRFRASQRNHWGMTGSQEEATLSIVIPCFNSSESLEKCIASIDADERVEIILVDDGSTDGTSDVARGISKRRPELTIRLFENAHNMGPGGARNLGLKKARSKYIMFVDSDDELMKGCCESVLLALNQYDPDILFFDAFREVAGKRLYLKMFASPVVHGGVVPAQKAFVYGKGCTCGKVYRRELVEEYALSFFHTLFGEDVLFSKSAFARARTILYLDAPLYVYKENDQSLSHGACSLDETVHLSLYSELLKRVQDLPCADELNALYYTLVVYPTMIALLRQGACDRKCANVFDSMIAGYQRPDRYFMSLESKFKIAYFLFRFHLFKPLRWAIGNG